MCNLLFIPLRINSKLLTLSYSRASLRTRKWASALGPTIQQIKNTPMIHLLTNTRVPVTWIWSSVMALRGGQGVDSRPQFNGQIQPA